MTILHILAPSEIGGLERVVQSLARGLGRLGHRLHVAAVLDSHRHNHPFLDAFTGSDVDVLPISVGPRQYLKEQAEVRRLCGRLAPDVVHTHGYRADVVDGWVARRLNHPTVSTVHGFTGGSRRNRFYEWLQLRSLRRFDAVVAVSQALAKSLVAAGVPSGRVIVLRNAWSGKAQRLDSASAREMLGVDTRCLHIGWAGRISREKGLDILIESLLYLTDVPLHLSVLGDGPEVHRLRSRLDNLGQSERVTWHGVVPDADHLFSAFDVFVLSSRTEGTPMVLFEALSAGVPIVATEVGGVPDVVTPREALLVPPDDPSGLAAAIRAVYADRDSAMRRAREGERRLLSVFSAEPWLRAYERVYQQVFGVKRGLAGS